MFSSRPSVPPRPRYLHGRKRKDAMDVKTVAQNNRKDDKNVKNATNNTSSTLNRITRVPAASVRPRISEFGRSTMGQTKAGLGKKNTIPTTSKFKPKTVHLVPEPSSDLDPNCNEPSLPCLCCDGHTPQDNRCVYNHNYNNNNTIAARTNIQLQPEQKHIQDEDPKIQQGPALGTHEITQNEPTPTESQPLAEKIGKPEMNSNEAEESDVHDEEDDDDDEDEDEDTLVPSCYDCPPSLLEFSLSSSTSSSSTSISSCSDFESDCPDTVSLSSQEAFSEPSLTSRSPSTEIQIIEVQSQHVDALSLTPCSPDEGYPSARSSPLSEFLEKKGSLEQEGTKVDLLGLIDSMEELDKVGHINMIVQVARWDLEGDLGLKDRLSHLDRLELVNRQVKMIHLERIREAGLDLLEEDFSDALDGMGFDVSWKLYKGSNRCDSQEFSDAGVDLTAPSDIDETLAPDSLAPSPLQPPPRPPKPPKRQIETHTYMNVEDVKTTSEKPTPSFASSATKSEQPVPQSPSQSIPYFTFFSPTPTLVSPSPPPPIPPPRRRHKARLEAQKFAELHDEPTPVSLPPPTTRPPPLPPPPAFPSPPAIPPPPSLPPPPSFHALDAEIRKLLVLAGLTQAELLKLSPELGVCVTGVLEEGEAELLETVATEVRKDESEEKKETHCESKKSNEWKQCAREEMTELAFKDARGQSAHDGVTEARGDNRESFRTTSFTEMARRRKRNSGNFSSSCNCGYGLNPIPNHDPYFSSMDGNTDDLNSSRNNNDYAEIPCSTPPPPPPPRPLPPCPPCLSHPILAPALQPLDLCTIPANASRPDRFDWLMAFSPDTETPLSAIGKSTERSPLKKKEGTKTTTFKELRFRSRQNPPAAPSAPPEPDPTVVTPDPDVLYNLKWRKGKPDGDGSQWEYVPQLQSFLLQPPTTLTSLKEALHMRNTEREAEGHASKFIGFSISDSNLWTSGSGEEVKPQRKTLEKEKEKEEDGEVRGSADGGRKWESRTTVTSHPLSPVLAPPLHYYLHPKPQAAPQNIESDSLYCSDLTCKEDPLSSTDANDNRGAAGAHAPQLCAASGTQAEGCTTPYRNVEVIEYHRAIDHNSNQLMLCDGEKGEFSATSAWYFYSPKNCPMHKGASPRLSPVGAISPPKRIGAPLPGADVSRLCSPLFPRSRTLPTLAAPHYCPCLPPTTTIAPQKEPQGPKHTKQTRLYTLTVRSLSFAGSAQRDETWMEDPDIGSKQSSVCLREKKALLSTVSVAVEAVLGHFSSSRTQVQKAPPQSLTDVKAQLGDSSINPSLGWLVLQCLCPALRDLLADGLKPHQSDVIAGRRPNTPWSLVQASTKPGPSTQALYSLQCRVADLPQLRQSRHRFNAFLFGLLNVKLLDYWLSHLHSCDDVLQAYYLPTSFMRFSHSLGRPLFEELLLVLQPLSLLSFSLDLLFQHHHVDPASPGPSPLSLPSLTSEGGSPEACELQDRDSSSLSQQASQALQHGWGAVVRWGERLGQAWTNSSSPAQPDVVLHPSEGGPVMPWALGRLFGVTKGDSSTVTRTSPTRRPSHWLAPGVSALSRMVRPTAQSPVDEERPSMATHPALRETGDALTPYRSVRTLCEHTGTGAELSFQKGEELVVLGSVDHDWIRCRRGDREGLVSIGYTSLIM